MQKFLLSSISLRPVDLVREGPQGQAGIDAPVEMSCVSSGSYQVSAGDIFIDTCQVSNLTSGYNLARMSSDGGAIAESMSFSVGSDRRSEKRLKDYVDSLPANTIVAISVLGDGAYRAKGWTESALSALGADNSPAQQISWAEWVSKISGVTLDPWGGKLRGDLFSSRFRWSYALIGAKGAESGHAIEKTDLGRSIIAAIPKKSSIRAGLTEFISALAPAAAGDFAKCASSLSEFFSGGTYRFIRTKVVPNIRVDDYMFFNLLGRRLSECSMFNEAIDAYSKSIKLKENASGYFAKAVLQATTGDYHSAQRNYITGADMLPIPLRRRLKELDESLQMTAIEAIFAASSDGRTPHFVNGMRTVMARNGWALTAVNPTSGAVLSSRTFGVHDERAIAESLTALPNGTIIILSLASNTAQKIGLVLTNAIQANVRRKRLPHDVYRNLVLIGLKSKKSMAFYRGEYDQASLLVTGD